MSRRSKKKRAKIQTPSGPTPQRLRPKWTSFRHVGPWVIPFMTPEGLYLDRSELYVNSLYQVHLHDDGLTIHLSIKPLDNNPIQDWRELQRLKNELLGDEVEAVQLYPAESRLVDSCDQIHLWALKEGMFPFGFNDGRKVSEGTTLPGQSQRPFDVKPKDLIVFPGPSQMPLPQNLTSKS